MNDSNSQVDHVLRLFSALRLCTLLSIRSLYCSRIRTRSRPGSHSTGSEQSVQESCRHCIPALCDGTGLIAKGFVVVEQGLEQRQADEARGVIASG